MHLLCFKCKMEGVQALTNFWPFLSKMAFFDIFDRLKPFLLQKQKIYLGNFFGPNSSILVVTFKVFTGAVDWCPQNLRELGIGSKSQFLEFWGFWAPKKGILGWKGAIFFIALNCKKWVLLGCKMIFDHQNGEMPQFEVWKWLKIQKSQDLTSLP